MNLYLDTKISRDIENPKILDFHVTADKDTDPTGVKQDIVGELSGFLIDIPWGGWIEDINYDVFDAHSANASEAYYILDAKADKVAAALRLEINELSSFDMIIFLADCDVDEDFRRNGLALRLMRELAYLFMNTNPLFILKAHPTQNHVSDKDCRKLAAYYGSDTALGFKEIDPENLAGWLVGCSTLEIKDTSDRRYFECKITEK